MKISSLAVALLLATTGYLGPAAADPWKDESGHGRWIGRYEHGDHDWGRHRYERHTHKEEFKEEYWEGGCKIEREWDEGEYKEEIKCERGWRPPAYIYDY